MASTYFLVLILFLLCLEYSFCLLKLQSTHCFFIIINYTSISINYIIQINYPQLITIDNSLL